MNEHVGSMLDVILYSFHQIMPRDFWLNFTWMALMVKNLNMVNNWYVVKIDVDEHFRPTDFKGPSEGGGGGLG